MPARVFVCRDTAQQLLMDNAAEALAAAGHCVVRGPPDIAGLVKSYDALEREALIDDADVLVLTTRHACTRELMEGARRLRGVVFPVIGVDSIDLAAAETLGVIVGHGAVRGNVVGMAEATVMLILMLLYDVQANVRRLQDGLWRRAVPAGRQLEGKIVGLIGFGRIAQAMTSPLLAFGARVVTVAPRTPQHQLPAGVGKVELAELLAQSDVVAVLTGLTNETRGLIGAAELTMMKPGALLVNTSRGGVVDESALYRALRDNVIAGAALDAFAVEPLPANSPLRSLANVILTPHGVGHTIEGNSEFVPAIVENVRRIVAGELPLYCKNAHIEASWRERIARLDAD